MTFTPESAIKYLRNKSKEFFRQSAVLTEQLKAAGRLKQEAIKNNDQPTIGKLIIAQQNIKELLLEQLKLEQHIQPFAEAFGLPTLGMFPLFLIPLAAGVASLLYLHFQKIDNQRKALDLIAKGAINPAQAERLLDSNLGFGQLFGGTMGLIAPWALGLGAFWLFLAFKKD